MSKLYYVCKYTPVELLRAYGADTEPLNAMCSSFDCADQLSHPNVCGFGKAIIEAVFEKNIKELILVNCCDSIRSVYDVLHDKGDMDFLYFMDLVHEETECGKSRMAYEIGKLAAAYEKYSGNPFDTDKFKAAFSVEQSGNEPFIAVLGGRMGDELFDMAKDILPYKLKNLTCVSGRSIKAPDTTDEGLTDTLIKAYADCLLEQIPCMRMNDITGRKQIVNNPNLKGIVYHTVKFCDYYGFEYSVLKDKTDLPLLKIESDFTRQSGGQLRTRLEAFAEGYEIPDKKRGCVRTTMGKGYYAGIDSGSTSTDVVIMDKDKRIIASEIMPTGAGATAGAKKVLEACLEHAGLTLEDIDAIVSTGYGRGAIAIKDKSVTEITCHAKGAVYLNPQARTIIDIGGQDSKVIKIDGNGNVLNFVMNDKCAAGTGRFLDMVARTLEIGLDELSGRGIFWKENITISSMCTVFAESELVGLIAENRNIDDIVHGLNLSVASKTASLVKRAGGEPDYMMTGGVAQNRGLVKTLAERLGSEVSVSPYSQYCGAIGAALFAMEMN